MAITFNSNDDEEVIAAINTTPLVDVMLVLLIIFLITIPVVVHNVPVRLPPETNIPTKTKPENVTISVDQEGGVFWGTAPIAGTNALVEKLKAVAVQDPQPEILIRGDQDARYEAIGKIVFACQRAGIEKIGFITQPPARGG